MSPRRAMAQRRLMAALVVGAFAVLGCDYIVAPVDLSSRGPGQADLGWAGIVTNVAESGGALRVDLSIMNNTSDWSAMDVAASRAKVTDAAGTSHDCGTVFVGTSVFVDAAGWYLPPGFVMSGYTGGSLAKPATQPLSVECAGVTKASGETLTIRYSYIVGPFNYYVPSQIKTANFELSLDKIVTDTKYPVAQQAEGLKLEKPGDPIGAINGATVRLTGAKRTDKGLEFDWDSTNPTKYPVYVHIGQPPVIGTDGVLYGFYESPHLADAPITPSGGDATWTTTIAAPKGTGGFYLLVPVETQQQKYFVDHVLDITDR